jgi:hypothetical protein
MDNEKLLRNILSIFSINPDAIMYACGVNKQVRDALKKEGYECIKNYTGDWIIKKGIKNDIQES